MSDQVEFLTKQLRFERSRSADEIKRLHDEINRLRAAMKEILELRHDVTCAHIIAEEALENEI